MNKLWFVVLINAAVAWSSISPAQIAPAGSAALDGPVTAADVAPYVRNAYVHDPSTLIKCKASYLYQHGGEYFLFVNWGICCRGTNSTYSIHVGRSRKVTGPYRGKAGNDMLFGGGTLFLDSTGPYIGPGHAGIIIEQGTNWFSCHFEAGAKPSGGAAAGAAGPRRGSPLAVIPMRWTPDNWPELDLKPAAEAK
jgi:beta-xylosidase